MWKDKFEITQIKNNVSGEILTERCLKYINDVIKFYMLQDKKTAYRIHQIKRLSDGELFTIGDEVEELNEFGNIKIGGWGKQKICKFHYDVHYHLPYLTYFEGHENFGLQIIDRLHTIKSDKTHIDILDFQNIL